LAPGIPGSCLGCCKAYNISDHDYRNVGEPLRGERQTNQRAELVAIARALDHVPIDRDVEIRTDSYYSIRCLREWFQNWETKGWRNAAGKSVENKELIQPILARIRERLTCKGKTTFTWVKGHSTDEGNIAADALANEGMDKWTPELTAGTPFDMSETLRTKYTLPSLTKPKQEDFDEFGEDPFKDYFDGLEAERVASELAHDVDKTVAAQPSANADSSAKVAVQKDGEGGSS
jgi:ribonuclease HI